MKYVFDSIQEFLNYVSDKGCDQAVKTWLKTYNYTDIEEIEDFVFVDVFDEINSMCDLFNNHYPDYVDFHGFVEYAVIEKV